MSSVSRRSLVAFAICCGALLASQALFVSIPTSAASGSSCTELRRWAQSYRGTSPTLDQLARYDRAHRIAIFNTVSPQVRATLWQEQLRRFDQGPDLSLAQHQLIGEARELITPELYEHSPVVTASFKDLTSRVDKAFTAREQKQVLSILAFATVAPRTQATSLWDKLTSPFIANAQAPNCECNSNFGAWECLSGGCPYSACNWISGCGFGGQYVCNGLCS